MVQDESLTQRRGDSAGEGTGRPRRWYSRYLNVASVRYQVGASLGAQVVGNIATFAVAVLLARVLGKVAIGRASFIFGASAFLATIATLGGDRAILYFLPGYDSAPNKARSLVKSALLCSIGASVVVGLGVFFARGWLASVLSIEGFARDAVFLAVMIPLLSTTVVLSGVLSAAGRVDLRALASNVVFPTGFLMLTAGGLAIGFGLDWVLTGRAISLGVTIVATVLLLKRFAKPEWLPTKSASQSDYTDFRKWRAYAIPSMFAGTMHYMMNHLDVLMLGGIASAADVGSYAVAARAALPLVLLGAVFARVLEPRISKAFHADGLASIHGSLSRATLWLFRLLIAFAGIAVLGRAALVLIFGAEFDGAAVVLLWLVAAYAASTLGIIGATILHMTGHPRLELLNTAVAILANVIANLIFIPRYGAAGAAIATALSLSVASVLRVVQTLWLHRWYPFSWSHALSIASGVLVFALAYQLPWPWPVQLAVFTSMYVGSLLVFDRMARRPDGGEGATV